MHKGAYSVKKTQSSKKVRINNSVASRGRALEELSHMCMSNMQVLKDLLVAITNY